MTDKEKVDLICGNTAEISGGVTSTTLGFLVAGPPGALLGAGLSGPITNALKKLMSEVSDKILTPMEKVRVSAGYYLAAKFIKEKLDNGETPRQDDFFTVKEDDRSSGDTILEGILIKLKNEYEEKKVEYYSHYLANISFYEKINYENALTLLKIIEKLSYNQLVLISHFKDLNRIKFKDWTRAFINMPEVQEYRAFYYELRELYELNILKQYSGHNLGGPENGELTFLGKELYLLMELTKIPNKDKQTIQQNIDQIKGIILKANSN